MKPIEIDKPQISVSGLNTEYGFTQFNLTLREIKHIRRCIEFYSLFHPQLPFYSEDNYSIALYNKFKTFGRISLRGHQGVLKRVFGNKDVKCQYEGCEEKKNLTIDHIKPILHGGNGIENLQFLCPQHHLLKELKSVLFFKEAEVSKLKEEIIQTEKGENPSILGYNTLDNKFVREDDNGES